MNIKIGSRKSELAIKQTEAVIKKLSAYFQEDSFEIVGISTHGDKDSHTPLQSFGGKGVFVKEIESALISGEIDMAVHSAKDMPTELDDRLEISAALLREDRSDVLVYYGDTKIADIKTIGTSSARREIQSRAVFPDAVYTPIRGNIRTRLEKVKSGDYDAVIMARAALSRLNIRDVNIFEFGSDFVCAAGQGILAVETARGKMKKYTDAINEDNVMRELTAERAFLRGVGGGCHTPCGASAVYKNGMLTMRVFYRDTKKSVHLEMSGSDPALLGAEMARVILAKTEGQ